MHRFVERTAVGSFYPRLNRRRSREYDCLENTLALRDHVPFKWRDVNRRR